MDKERILRKKEVADIASDIQQRMGIIQIMRGYAEGEKETYESIVRLLVSHELLRAKLEEKDGGTIK